MGPCIKLMLLMALSVILLSGCKQPSDRMYYDNACPTSAQAAFF